MKSKKCVIPCVNCSTQVSSRWRKIDKKNYCNACGCYYKRHKNHRFTLEMCADVLLSIQTQNDNPN